MALLLSILGAAGLFVLFGVVGRERPGQPGRGPCACGAGRAACAGVCAPGVEGGADDDEP